MTDDLIGKEIDGYRIEDELGRGGMGVVYRAKDVNLSRSVAIKRINPSQAHREQFIHRFRAEAKALARIDSPHIVGVYALRETDHGLFIVMEFVDGGTLHDRIDGAGPVPFDEAMPVLRQILQAMSDAHSAGVIHRDLKPHNILLTEGGTVKITDFGIAKMRQPETEETVTQGGEGGTLTYMSPEQNSDIDAVDDRSDLYSIGMVAYGMLAGRLPFDPGVPDFDIMRKVVEGDIPPPTQYNQNLPDPLVRWMMRAIAQRQDDRYQSASAMLGALQEVRRIVTSDDGADTGVNLSIGTPLAPDATTQFAAPDDETVFTSDSDADAAVDAGADTEADTAPDWSNDAAGTGLDGPTVLDTGLDAGDTASSDTESGDTTPRETASSEDEKSNDTASEDVTSPNRTLLDRAASAGEAATSQADRKGFSGATAGRNASGDSETSGSASADDAPDTSEASSGGSQWMGVAAGVVVALLVGAGAMWMTTSSSDESPTPTTATKTTAGDPATLTLTSSPSGASVYVDGDSVGTTPLSGHALAAGAVVVRLQKPGYAPVDTALRVDAGASVLLRDVRLTSTERHASPALADASDSEASDPASSTTSPSNTSTASESEPAPSEPEPTPAQLTVEADAGGTVLIDGVEQGATGTFSVAPGRRTVMCRHPEYGQIDTTLAVSTGAAQTLTCYFEQPLSVTTRGPWGNVWIDGQNTGASTPHTMRLTPGRHRVELRIARSDDFRIVGGAYRARAGDVNRARESFQGTSHIVTVRPDFQEVRHAIAFDVQ